MKLLFHALYAFLITLFKGTRDFITNGIKPAVHAVNQIKDAIESPALEAVTLLIQQGYKTEQLSQIAQIILVFFPISPDNAQSATATINEFVTALRKQKLESRRVFYVLLAAELSKTFYKGHGLRDYQVDTLVQVWYAASKEGNKAVRNF